MLENQTSDGCSDETGVRRRPWGMSALAGLLFFLAGEVYGADLISVVDVGGGGVRPSWRAIRQQQ